MTPENNTPSSPSPLRYEHSTVSPAALEAFLDAVYAGADYKFVSYESDYNALEYLNSPCGVIIFAFHGHDSLDTFYPNSFDFKERTGITPFYDMIGPATEDEACSFRLHRMGRKINGFVVRGAFGEMVAEGDPRAVSRNDEFQRLDVFDSPAGLIVVAHVGDVRYVIHSAQATFKRAAHVIAGGVTQADMHRGNVDMLKSMSRAAGFGA